MRQLFPVRRVYTLPYWQQCMLHAKVTWVYQLGLCQQNGLIGYNVAESRSVSHSIVQSHASKYKAFVCDYNFETIYFNIYILVRCTWTLRSNSKRFLLFDMISQNNFLWEPTSCHEINPSQHVNVTNANFLRAGFRISQTESN